MASVWMILSPAGRPNEPLCMTCLLRHLKINKRLEVLNRFAEVAHDHKCRCSYPLQHINFWTRCKWYVTEVLLARAKINDGQKERWLNWCEELKRREPE